MAKLKHGPNNLQNYLDIHHHILGKYVQYFSKEPQYDQELVNPDYLILKLNGVVTTSKGTRVQIRIEKHIAINKGVGGQRVAQCVDYTYNANIAGVGNLIRYCSPHSSHNQFHHKHLYDKLGQPIDPPIKIGKDDWPHVHEFLDEVLQNF